MLKKLIAVLAIIIILLVGWYLLKDSLEETAVHGSNPQNTTYYINNEPFTLINGTSEEAAAPESSAKIITKYFGNNVRTDLNDDGREDVVFLLTQKTGGSGTFFYAAAALNTESGWQGSHATLLGDRIAPQTTEMSQDPLHQNVVVVNYLDRNPGEAMSEQPSVGKSIWLKLDLASMHFGEVAQNFEGEADPSIMTLDMQSWTWVKTTYNNDTEVVPNQPTAFTITFKDNGAFSATTDCNTMSGTYGVTGDSIAFNNIVSTLMFCEDSQEHDFAKTLEETQSFFFTSRGELILELKFDSGSATFR